MQEVIVTGKKFKILKDVTQRIWHVISFWTKAQDVEFNDGRNAQASLGNISGISDSLISTSSNVAASANAVRVLNNKIAELNSNISNQPSGGGYLGALLSSGRTTNFVMPADEVIVIIFYINSQYGGTPDDRTIKGKFSGSGLSITSIVFKGGALSTAGWGRGIYRLNAPKGTTISLGSVAGSTSYTFAVLNKDTPLEY